jgi:carbon monoxide dehydrogenase subunit G
MELTNDFRVALPVDRAWAVLTDVEQIAPCLPGAQLQEIEGDEYRGIVKVKVGPITAQYKGQAKFLSLDPERHVAVLRAEGRETRGQGNANATITATLTPDGEGTAVAIATDLTVTGRVAQFGRGVLADVSAKLLDQFVADLEKTVLVDQTAGPTEAVAVELEDPIEAVQPDAGDPGAPPAEPELAVSPAPDAPVVDPPAPVEGEVAMAVAPSEEADKPAIRRVDSPEAKPVDLLDAAGTPVAKRVAPILVAVAIAWILKKLLTRNRD